MDEVVICDPRANQSVEILMRDDGYGSSFLFQFCEVAKLAIIHKKN
jgi:hypothetical protein